MSRDRQPPRRHCDPNDDNGDSRRDRRPRAPSARADDESSWRRALAAATANRAVVTAGELSAAGVPSTMRDHWLRQKRLHSVFRGVYLLGHDVPPPLALETAALKAAGTGSLLSHSTAAHLFGWTASPDSVHVVVLGRQIRRQPRLEPHTAPQLAVADRATHAGLAITAPARTLVDLAAGSDPAALDRMLQEAMARKQIRPADVRAALDRATDRRGAPLLRELVSDTHHGYSRSEGERHLLALIRQARLPEPERNRDIGSWNVDFLWRDRTLVVELDSYGAHISPWAFDRDRRKTIDLERRGYTVRRFSGRQLCREPYLVIAEIARVLA